MASDQASADQAAADDVSTDDATTAAAGTDDAGDVPPVTPVAGGSRWRRPVLVAAAAVVCLLAAGGGTYAAMHKTVTISVDGVPQEVSTLAGSVDGALGAAGLTVAEHDSLAPTPDAEITDGSQIVVQRGRLLTLTIDGKTREVWTTATTVDKALAELGQNPSDAQAFGRSLQGHPAGRTDDHRRHPAFGHGEGRGHVEGLRHHGQDGRCFPRRERVEPCGESAGVGGAHRPDHRGRVDHDPHPADRHA